MSKGYGPRRPHNSYGEESFGHNNFIPEETFAVDDIVYDRYRETTKSGGMRVLQIATSTVLVSRKGKQVWRDKVSVKHAKPKPDSEESS